MSTPRPRYQIPESPLPALRAIGPEVDASDPQPEPRGAGVGRMPGERNHDRPMAFWKAALLLGLLSLAFAALARFFA